METAEDKIRRIVREELEKKGPVSVEKMEVEEPTISEAEFAELLKEEPEEKTVYICPECKFESKDKFTVCPSCGENVKFE